MGKTYEKFLRTGIDLAPLGIARSEESHPYFCTPKGAAILGWAGADGIHYCFVRGFGDMVFAVTPMDGPPYVRPIAADFDDLIRLLLACGDASVLDQAWMFENDARFAAHLAANPPTPQQQAVLTQLADQRKLTPMPQPRQYIQDLQAAFDPSKLRYTADFYDPDMNPNAPLSPPAWKVYYEGGFYGRGSGRAGKETPLGVEFDWAGRHWVVPACYPCADGLVVDYCMQVQPDAIRSFKARWGLDTDDAPSLDRDARLQMEAENPLALHFAATLLCGSRELISQHGYAVCWDPCLPDGCTGELEAQWALAHYGLDERYGWIIQRTCYPWPEGKRILLRRLTLTLTQQKTPLPGPRFAPEKPGDRLSFVHPATGTAYTLTALELEAQQLPHGHLNSRDWDYPTHFLTMTYRLEPAPPKGLIHLQDTAEGDHPRPKAPPAPAAPLAEKYGLQASIVPTAVVSVGVMAAPRPDPDPTAVIGGADGPTAAVVLGRRAAGQPLAVCSALHFAPIDRVAWRITFHETWYEPMTVTLL